jgi:7-carboxy-7-deazaguanine synthase
MAIYFVLYKITVFGYNLSLCLVVGVGAVFYNMKLIELFGSVQGEGPDAGLPTVFVRSARCNLRCVWCDSSYTFGEGEDVPFEEVVSRVLAYQLPAACLTGGEPMLNPEMPPLAVRLLAEGLAVSMFTNGTRQLDVLPREVRKVVDLKPPSSMVGVSPTWSNLACLDSKDVVKFVLRDERDFQWAKQTALAGGLLGEAEGSRLRRVAGKPVVWLAPSFGDLAPHSLVEWILRDRVEARLNLQQHKFIWDPDRTGV